MVVAKEEKELTVIQIIAKISSEAGALAPEMNDGLKFAFRGVNQTVNHLAPYFDKYGLVILPELIDSEIEMHQVGNRYLTDCKVKVQYNFYAPGGDSVSVTTEGYAQDYADRAAAQAQSVAFRVALLQTFHLPTADIEPELNGANVEKITAEAHAEVAKAAPKAGVDTVESISKRIGAMIADEANPYDGVAVNLLGDKVTGKARDSWRGNLSDLKKVIAAMEKGEVA